MVCAKKSSPAPKPRLGDSKIIQCDVCRVFAAEARASLKKSYFQPLKKSKPEVFQRYQVSLGEREEKMQDYLEKVCDSRKKEGQWIRNLDIVANEQMRDFLVSREQPAKCRVECATIEHACSQVRQKLESKLVKYFLATETAVDSSAERVFQELACENWSSSCKNPTALPPLPPGFGELETFDLVDSKELELENIMANMPNGGEGVEAFHRDDVKRLLGEESVGESRTAPSPPRSLFDVLLNWFREIFKPFFS